MCSLVRSPPSGRPPPGVLPAGSAVTHEAHVPFPGPRGGRRPPPGAGSRGNGGPQLRRETGVGERFPPTHLSLLTGLWGWGCCCPTRLSSIFVWAPLQSPRLCSHRTPTLPGPGVLVCVRLSLVRKWEAKSHRDGVPGRDVGAPPPRPALPPPYSPARRSRSASCWWAIPEESCRPPPAPGSLPGEAGAGAGVLSLLPPPLRFFGKSELPPGPPRSVEGAPGPGRFLPLAFLKLRF